MQNVDSRNSIVENIKQALLKQELVFSYGTFSLLFSTVILLLCRNILHFSFNISEFSNHIISQASSFDINIGNRVGSYSFLFIGLLVIALFVFSVLSIIHQRKIKKNYSLKWLGLISFVGLISGIGSLLRNYIDQGFFICFFISIFFYIFVIAFKTTELKRFFVFILLDLLIIYIFSSIFKNHIVIMIIGFPMTLLMLCILNSFASINLNKLILIVLPFSFVIPLQSLLIEVLNVINVKTDLLFTLKEQMLAVLSILAVVLGILQSRKKQVDRIAMNKQYYKFIFGVVIGLSLIIAQPAFQAYPEIEFFESANHALSLDQFFNFGKLPFIETYDAHMLNLQLFPFLNSLISGYELYTPFLYNSYLFLLFSIPFFICLRHLLGRELALLVLLVVPSLSYIINPIYVYALFPVFVFIKYRHTLTIQNYFVLWLAAFCLCLFRLDTGVAAFGGMIVTMLLYHYLVKRINLKQGFVTLIITGSFFVFLFIFLTLIKGISPLSRLHEFFITSLSNQNWAYNTIGDPNNWLVIISYIIIPVLNMFYSIYVVLKVKVHGKIKSVPFILFCFLTLFYYINISRGVIRHSYYEGTLIFTYSTLFAAIFSSLFVDKNFRLISFKFTGKVIILFITAIVLPHATDFIFVDGTPHVPAYKSLIHQSYEYNNYWAAYDTNIDLKGTRVAGSSNPHALRFKEMLDTLLEEDETYFDLSSFNLFYAITERSTFTYVNQSPLLLNGDKSQEYVLSDLMSDPPPIAIVPIQNGHWSIIDGMNVNYKYYILSSWIYKNYKPLVRLHYFDVFSRNDLHQLFMSKLEQDGRHVELIGSYPSHSIMQKETEAGIEIEQNGIDPHIFDLLKDTYSEGLFNPTVSISILSENAGSIDLFYKTIENNNLYNGNDFKRYNIVEGINQIVISIPGSLTNLRIDNDVKGKMLIQNISISTGFNIIKRIPEAQLFNLGQIPFLWTNRGANDYRSHERQYIVSLEGISHIFNEMILKINSSTNDLGTFYIKDNDGNLLSQFSFNINPGVNLYSFQLGTMDSWFEDIEKSIEFDEKTQNKLLDVYIVPE